MPRKEKNYDAQSEASKNVAARYYQNLTEETFFKSSYWSDSMLSPYNPDPIVRKANDYSIYEKMLMDDQISICLQIKKDLVLNSGWEIITKEEGQEDIVADLQKALTEDPEESLDDYLDEIISAYEFGFSLSEKIFQKRPDGKISLKTIKTRHPATWLIYQDDQGNIEKIEQRGKQKDIIVDQKNLIHHKINTRFGVPYGTSDLLPAYASWMVKNEVVKYFAIYLEKYSGPIPVAKYPQAISKQAKDDLFKAIKTFQTKTALSIPKEVEIEFLNATGTGEVYERAINILNMFIARALFVPDLMGFSGEKTGGGSYALGEHQIDVFIKHIMKRRRQLERIVNDHMVKPICFWNWGILEDIPTFRFKPIKEENAIEAAKLWLEAIKSASYKPTLEEINHFRKTIQFPENWDEPEEDELVPNNELGTNQEKDPNQDNKESMPDDKEDKKVVPIRKEIEKKNVHETCTENKKVHGIVHDYFVANRELSPYERKTDFALLDKKYTTELEAMLIQVKPIVDLIFEDLFDQIQKKKILQDRSIEAFDSIKLRDLKDLKLVLKKHLRDFYDVSQGIAISELFKEKFATPLPADEFLAFLENEVFSFIGDWQYSVLKDAKVRLIEAIKDGQPMSSVIADMEKGIIMPPSGNMKNPLVEGGTQEQMGKYMVQIDRYARTKLTEVMNKGRKAVFEQSGLVDGYQFSAIMDDRTTVLCAGLDGKNFVIGTEPTPPLHFNCRSTLVPITKYETFTPDLMTDDGEDIFKFINENKGKGFSVN